MQALRKKIRCSARSGLTLIELLVTVSIIALLLGLVLPAVQYARESARQAACRSNLHQIGVSLHSYHSVHNMFPAGYLFTGPNYSTNRMSGFVYLLPHVDMAYIYDSINMSLATVDSPSGPTIENRTARRAGLTVLICPSDGESQHRCNYRFNLGRSVREGALGFDGPFGIGVLPSQASITDGLSSTAFVSERVSGSFVADGYDPQRDMKLQHGGMSGSTSDAEAIDRCLLSLDASWYSTEGRYWFYKGMTDTDYNHNGLPNDPRPSCGGQNFGLQPPRSYHRGFVHVLFGDSHLEAIQNSVSVSLWRSLGTHASGD